MKFMFYPSLVTLLLSSTTLTYAVDAVDDEGEPSVQRFPAAGVASERIWKDQFYTKKYPFSDPALDINELNRAVIKKELNAERLHQLLLEGTKNKNPQAQKKLYLFYTKKFMGINLVDAKAAEILLQEGLEQEQTWAFWIKAQQAPVGTVTRWHCLAANRGHGAAKIYVEQHLDYKTKNAKAFLSAVHHEKNKKKRRVMAKEFEKRWVKLSYAKPFLDVWQILQQTGRKYQRATRTIDSQKFLEQAAALGNLASIEICCDTFFKTQSLSQIHRYALSSGNSDLMYYAGTLLGEIPEALEMALDLYLQAAEKGEVKAMCDAGGLLVRGFEGQKPDKKRALELWLWAAKKGQAEAMFNAGVLLKEGFKGQKPDKKRALELWLQASEDGQINSMFNAGVLLEEGFEGQKPDKKRALELWLQAAREQHVGAMFNAGELLLGGFEDQEPNKKGALELWLWAAEKGHAEAMFNAGVLLKEGFKGQKPDKKRVLELWLWAAEKGEVKAMSNAGGLLVRGFEGQKPDKKRALELWLWAAKKGHAEAMSNAGGLLVRGFEGQKPDKKRALELWLWAAKKGQAEAMFNAGVLLKEGFEGQEPNKKRALKLFLQAAEKGYVGARFDAGGLLNEGFEGQEPNKKRALKLWLQVAEKGDARGMNNAGVLFSEGFEGQLPDKKRALELYLQAVQKKDVMAMHNAGILFCDGFEGQKPDLDHAVSLFSRAAEKGQTSSMVELAKYHLGLYSDDYVDIEKALFWLEKARFLGEPLAGRYFKIAEEDVPEEESEAKNADEEVEALLKESRRSLSQRNLPKPSKALVNEDESLSSSSDEESGSESEEEEKGVTPTPPLHGKIVEDAGPADVIEHDVVRPANKIRNPKYVRAQLRKAYQLREQRNAELQSPATVTLSKHSQITVNHILGEGSENVDRTALDNLFKDPFFQHQVIVNNTKSGISVVAHNRVTNKHASAGTHRKHTKRYKGHYNPAFFKKLRGILGLFGLSAMSSSRK